MTIPREIIELVIKGGYKMPKPCDFEGTKIVHCAEIALDPDFWRILGKERGWKRKNVCQGCFLKGFAAPKDCDDCVPEWRQRAAYFFDLVLTGQSTEEFWRELLK
jgi:hypothetical protein